MNKSIDELALKVGATHYSPAPMRAVKGWSFTFEQLQALIAEYEKAAGSEPVALPSLPGGIVSHAQLGELFDRLQMQTYAVKYAGIYHPDPRVAELEAEIVAQKAEWNKAYDIGMLAKHKLAELEQQNAALLVAIEATDAALDSLVSWVDDWAETSDTDFTRIETQVNAARALSPSSELLEARDRKRDAKLLRAAGEWFKADTFIGGCMSRLAIERESGEWKPAIGE